MKKSAKKSVKKSVSENKARKATKKLEVLTCHELQLRDSHDRLRILMTTSKNGDPSVSLFDESMYERIVLHFDPDGQPQVCLLYPDGKTGIGFALTDKLGIFGVYDSQGEVIHHIPEIDERYINDVVLRGVRPPGAER